MIDNNAPLITMWAARSEFGDLTLFSRKPILERHYVTDGDNQGYLEWQDENYDGWLNLDEELLPEVTFENSPRKVEVNVRFID